MSGPLIWRIEELVPEVQDKCRAHLESCGRDPWLVERHVSVRLNETKRTRAVQLAYAVQGRFPLLDVNTVRGEIGLWKIGPEENNKSVTWTLLSKHIDGKAYDMVPVRDGKAWWAAPREIWERIGELGEECGMMWGGRWKSPDSPHFEI